MPDTWTATVTTPAGNTVGQGRGPTRESAETAAQTAALQAYGSSRWTPGLWRSMQATGFRCHARPLTVADMTSSLTPAPEGAETDA